MLQTAIEQTLSLAGYHDIRILFDYYDGKIRKYHDRLVNECDKLRQNLIKQIDKVEVKVEDQ